MDRHRILASVALGLLAGAPIFIACGSTANPSSDSDAGYDAGAEDSAFTEDTSVELPDAGPVSTAQCLLTPEETDPVGLCTQKAAILAIHAVIGSAGVPASWSVDTLAPATDAGVVEHSPGDDVAYGAALAAYAASAAAYQDTQINAVVKSDLASIAHLVEVELSTLPADYDGALYFHLRRFAAGLRAAGLADAEPIDQLAVTYGTAIYATYFHPLAQTTTTDGGDDAAVSDAGSVDAGSASDGILGTPSGGAIAYRADSAASGALALLDMAERAANGTITAVDAGADATTLASPALADAWSQASNLVFAHLLGRARDTSGLYFTQLQTSGDAGHDTVTDDGELTTETQGAVALSYVRAGGLLTATPVGNLAAKPFVDQALAILNVMQSSPILWDDVTTSATFKACNSPSTPLATCGSGYFAGIDATKKVFDTRKSSVANARLFAALHRASLIGALAEASNVIPMTALFVQPQGGTTAGTFDDNFYTQVAGQAACVHYVTQNFSLTEFADGGSVDDAGSSDPSARYYSTLATTEAIEALNDQWLGLSTAPPFFQ